eukprot:CAMPEP_0202419228 /NCGR_PEP_ID=MMETSP1128-20130828/48774_1 /ASSEMBLY_ACC=CAM_ASM_000463 /TAXON_ID=3047 /ORGANISM="Dunaliella tertiolecta, Strain CCMP1320" /LENGTH=284 /DNA_ID=CAMNT_0049027119 /DNA_START=103 /DNA_END=954 /DNA_ORIENTATION=-
MICGSCPNADHVAPLLTTAAQDLWPLYQRAYVHPIELMKRIILLKEVLDAAVAQWTCWHEIQPLLHTLVEVCTSGTEALCSLGKITLGALLPASASCGAGSSAGGAVGKRGAGTGMSNDQAAQEREQQQLQAQTVIKTVGAALMLLARMRPSLPAPRCVKLHAYLDALASTLLPLVASVQAIQPSTGPAAHLELKASALSLSGSATQLPQRQSTDSISSTTSVAPLAGSTEQQASSSAHLQLLLGAVQSACHALCEAAGDASVGKAVAAGLQPHAVLAALLLQL